MNREPFSIRLPFCLFMLIVGLVNMAGSAVAASLNLAHGNLAMFAVNVVTAIVSAGVAAANVFFVANAAIRHSPWMR